MFSRNKIKPTGHFEILRLCTSQYTAKNLETLLIKRHNIIYVEMNILLLFYAAYIWFMKKRCVAIKVGIDNAYYYLL